ncbi:ABC transporter ATP-binding protein [Aeromicrobium alkaliterrae]|uniref:ABC transporter ATP-binding protein n=1 Tax=Aeromicrobium alkaliterrae TaxID=302168 RepID=A0ABN2JI40_9ACTN
MTLSAPPAVRLDGVTKTFGAVQAVRGIDLTIAPGEVVAFLGPNGAGKTTTIDLLLGLSSATTGTVEVFGSSPRDAVAHGRVAAVMQSGGLLKDFTIRETVELVGSLFRPARPAGEVLERAGLVDVADRLVGKASGGQQQRLRFALALIPDPDLLILDEPTTGMDVQGRRDFWNAIRDDATRGRTTLFATHYLEEADAYADRIVMVNHGRVVADGTASEVKAMAVGRTVRATWPGADTRALAAIEGVDAVDVRGDRVIVHAVDSDHVVRHLLTRTPAHDLEITTRNLEEAFVALTTDVPATEGALA